VTRRLAPAAIIVMIAACADAGGGGEPIARVDTLASGIVEVTNRVDLAPAWRLVLRQQFADTPGAELSDPSEILVDAAGRVYVLDDDPAVVRVFASDGRPLHTIGREGSGPGEFVGGGMIFLSHDTLVHQDPRQSRAQAFTLDGALITQWTSPCCVRVPTLADTLGRIPIPGDVGRLPPSEDDAGAGMGYLRYRVDGTLVDTLDFPPAPLPAMWRATDGRNRWNWFIPMQPTVAHVLDREGRMIWGSQRGGTFVISRTGRDTLARFVLDESPPAIPDSVRQAAVDDLVASNPVFANIAQVADVPTTYPAWSGLSVDDLNRTWILRPGPGGGADHWHVVDPHGRLLARVISPPLDAERLHIGARWVHALEPDQATGLDVVRVYEIVVESPD